MSKVWLLGLLLLAGCGESASTYDSHSGHYMSTDEYHERQIERAINKHDMEREERQRHECGCSDCDCGPPIPEKP
jgi:hypothetical protein